MERKKRNGIRVKTNAVLLCKSNAMLHFAVLYWRFAVKQKVSRETKKPDAVTRPVSFYSRQRNWIHCKKRKNSRFIPGYFLYSFILPYVNNHYIVLLILSMLFQKQSFWRVNHLYQNLRWKRH